MPSTEKTLRHGRSSTALVISRPQCALTTPQLDSHTSLQVAQIGAATEPLAWRASGQAGVTGWWSFD